MIIEPGDLEGNYDYIPDVETMKAPSIQDVKAQLMEIIGMVINPAVLQLLQQEGKTPKMMEILTRAFESTNIVKDAESLFEDVKGGAAFGQNQINQGGVPGAEGGLQPQGGMPAPGMGGGNPPVPNAGNQVGGGGPTPVQA